MVKISRKGINKERHTVTVGNIYIPLDQNDREKYVNNCIRTNKVCVLNENSSRVDNVTIPKNLINSISFPEDSKSLGSQVVMLNKPVQNIPIIVAVLNKNGELEQSNEHEFLLKKVFGDRVVELSGNAETGNILLKTNYGNITLSSLSDEGKINLNSNSEVNINSSKKVNVKVSEELNVNISNILDNELETKISYIRGVGFKYIDEFENEIEIKDGELRIKSPKITIENDDYSIKTLLDDIVTEISKATTATAIGTQPLINKAAILNLKNKIKKLFK